MINRIIYCDAVTGMRCLPNDHVPLTVTSPPFDAIRDYGGHHFDFEAIARELWRVTNLVVSSAGMSRIRSSTGLSPARLTRRPCSSVIWGFAFISGSTWSL